MIRRLLISTFLISASLVAHSKSDCKPDPNSERLAVIVDLSNILDEPARIAFTSLAGKIAQISPPGGMLYVYDLNKFNDVSNVAELSICVPSFTSLTGEKLRQRKEMEFSKSINEAFGKLSHASNSAPTSPILEGIYKVSFQVFNSDGFSRSGRIIIISDFEQNTNLLSFYKTGVPEYKEWKTKAESAAWSISMPKVKFTSILIQRTQKNPLVNQIKLRNFWLDYAGGSFQKCGFLGLGIAAVELKHECN